MRTIIKDLKHEIKGFENALAFFSFAPLEIIYPNSVMR